MIVRLWVCPSFFECVIESGRCWGIEHFFPALSFELLLSIFLSSVKKIGVSPRSLVVILLSVRNLGYSSSWWIGTGYETMSDASNPRCRIYQSHHHPTLCSVLEHGFETSVLELCWKTDENWLLDISILDSSYWISGSAIKWSCRIFKRSICLICLEYERYGVTDLCTSAPPFLLSEMKTFFDNCCVWPCCTVRCPILNIGKQEEKEPYSAMRRLPAESLRRPVSWILHIIRRIRSLLISNLIFDDPMVHRLFIGRCTSFFLCHFRRWRF